MTIYTYLKKFLKCLILILFISCLVELKFPHQEHPMKTVKEVIAKTCFIIMQKKDSKIILEKEIIDETHSIIMPENDWKSKNLKGKVRIMTEITYKYGYSGKDNEVKKIVTKYNENGYIIEELQYIQNREDPYRYKYKYNEKGLLVESNDYIYSYEHDKEGNLVQIKQQKHGAYLEKTTYSGEGKIVRFQTYTQNQYDKAGIKITADDNYVKIKNRDLFQRLSDYSYIYDKDGKLQEIRDNVFSSGTLKYFYEEERDLYVKTTEQSTQTFVSYYDKEGNEVYYMWITQPSQEFEPQIQLYLIFKDRKKDKYGNLTYQVANRVEVEDITTGKGNDKGIYEKKIIEYEYYE